MSLQPLDLTWALAALLPPLDFVLPGLLPGTFGLVVAPGAIGKSRLTQDVAASLFLGRPVAGGLFQAGPQGKVVFLAGEESDRLLANGRSTSLYDELRAVVQGAHLLIIDPLRRMHGCDENNSSDMTGFVAAMEQLAKATGAAVVGLYHANSSSSADTSSQNAARGSSALVGGARWQLNLSRMDEKTAEQHMISEAERRQYVALDFAKTNYLPPRPRCWLKRGPGGRFSLVQLHTATPKARAVGGARLLTT